jgi:hypothetical protein
MWNFGANSASPGTNMYAQCALSVSTAVRALFHVTAAGRP